MNDTEVRIGNPTNFRMPQILIVNAFGILLGLPCGVALGVGVGTIFGGLLLGSPTLLLIGFIALLVCAGILFFMPVLWGNPYVKKLVRDHAAASIAGSTNQFLVQLALHPRLHRGIRGWLEDADDIGILTISPSVLSFHGDHVSLQIPPQNISGVDSRNIGFRGLWFCGRRIRITSPTLTNHRLIEFADRSAIHVLGCKMNTAAIIGAVTSVVKQENPNQASHATSEPAPGAASSAREG